MPTLSELYWEGHVCGTSGFTWVHTVLGRFLTHDQRKMLAEGWRDGLKDRPSYLKDMESPGLWNSDPEMLL